MEMQHQQSQSAIMFYWEHLDEVRQRFMSLHWISDTRRRGKLIVKVKSEERDGEGSEISLENRGNTADIVEAVGIA